MIDTTIRSGAAEAERFLRFVIARRDPDSARPQGLFTLTYQLLRGGELEPDRHDRLKLAVEWFQVHLPVPRCPKIHPRGIFWFKAAEEVLVRHMWEIACVVEAEGHAVELIRTGKPGYIIYEDPYQVCAVPFRDTLE